MHQELRVRLEEDGANDERLDALAGYLRNELIQLDVEEVTALRIGEPPEGSRAIDLVAAGGLFVTLSQSAERLHAVVSAISSWLRRGSGAQRTVRLEIGGDSLELSGASEADQQRLIDLFISRHSSAGSNP
ncbi:MAG TPA: hypothetical protein VFZ63_15570 [Jiangellaceae bacterium]